MLHLLMEAKKGNLKDEDESVDSGFITSKKSHIEDSTKQIINNITVDDITAQALVFFIAGFDTSSTLTSFTTYELAINKNVQNKLRKEVDDTFEAFDGKLTYEALGNLKYMDMVISGM